MEEGVFYCLWIVLFRIPSGIVDVQQKFEKGFGDGWGIGWSVRGSKCGPELENVVYFET